MGNAGRVLMIPKGEYNAATTYEMLDFVYYNGRSYVCKQTSTGNVPTNTTYWQALTGDASAEIQALTNEVHGNWSEGGKNLLQNIATTQEKNGVTFTVNSDGTVTANGTSTSTIDIKVAEGIFENGKSYILSGCPSGGSTNTYMLYNGNANQIADTGNGKEFTYSSSLGNFVFIGIRSGVTLNNLVFKPMLTLATTPDSDYAHYQPYAKTNVELTQDVTPVNAIASVSVPSGTMSSDSYLYKVGKIVIAYFQITGVTASANDFVCTIPEGYRPLKNINGACKKSGDDSLKIMPVLYTGSVQTPVALSNNTFTVLAMSWITA